MKGLIQGFEGQGIRIRNQAPFKARDFFQLAILRQSLFMHNCVNCKIGDVACRTIAQESPNEFCESSSFVAGLVDVHVRHGYLLVGLDIATRADCDDDQVVLGCVIVVAVGKAGVVETTGSKVQ